MFKPSSHYYLCVFSAFCTYYYIIFHRFNSNMRTIFCYWIFIYGIASPVSTTVSLFPFLSLSLRCFAMFFPNCFFLIRFLYRTMLRRTLKNYSRWLCVCILAFCTCALAFEVWCTYLCILIHSLSRFSTIYHRSCFISST